MAFRWSQAPTGSAPGPHRVPRGQRPGEGDLRLALPATRRKTRCGDPRGGPAERGRSVGDVGQGEQTSLRLLCLLTSSCLDQSLCMLDDSGAIDFFW